MALSLFGDEPPKKKKPALPLSTLSTYVKPVEKVKEVRKTSTNRVSGDALKPLSEQDRKKLFPRGPVSLKMLKNETKRV